MINSGEVEVINSYFVTDFISRVVNRTFVCPSIAKKSCQVNRTFTFLWNQGGIAILDYD